jgi:alpha-galactosidase
MSFYIKVEENQLNAVFKVTADKDVRLLHFSAEPYQEQELMDDLQERRFRMLELHVSGENHDDHHGSKHTGTLPGGRLKYVGHKNYINNFGRKLEITTNDNGLTAVSHYQFYTGINVARAWTEVCNEGTEDKGLEYITSFTLTGLAKEGLQDWDKKCRLYIPHNTWVGELQWQSYTLPELGLSKVYSTTLKPLAFNSTGTWSTSKFLPMGVLCNEESGSSLIWQIEHNGSWHWEIGDVVGGVGTVHEGGQLYLHLSGPTETENHWWKNLKPGESFTTVPVSIGTVIGGWQEAFSEVVKYRRIIRRKNEDNDKLPVIFNDYMNCLFGDPTTEKLLPLIDAAAEAGCEYFCIDAGWYSDGPWWDGVGEWKPAKGRFPGGIKEPLDYIRSKGMIPGLWLEIEVMGTKCPLVEKVEDKWFFVRHGKKIIDRCRYQLDFRNPEVVKHADSVIERLVTEYGVGYIKMDYNINAGIGTEFEADSVGEGLLQHNRAYLKWLDTIFERYPELVIENCSSGGMRMDYALLSRHSIQSLSDQINYKAFAAISAAAPTAVTPEQGAAWAYPLKDGDKEEVIFNMINGMLLRIHQSGHLAEISKDRLELVKEGIAYYKGMRDNIKNGLPFWPLGLPKYFEEWTSMGLVSGKKVFIALWRQEGSTDTIKLPLQFLKGRKILARCGYPSQYDVKLWWGREEGSLSVKLPKQNTARLIEIEIVD